MQIHNSTNTLRSTLLGHVSDLNTLQDSISAPANNNFSGYYFLSGNISFEELSTSIVSEGSSNLYYTNERLLNANLRASDTNGQTTDQTPTPFDENTNLAAGLSLGETLDILQYKIKNRFVSSNGTPSVQITNESLEQWFHQ